MIDAVRLSFTIGLPIPRSHHETTLHENIRLFKRKITEMVCFHSGGCTVMGGIGHWVQGAEVNSDSGYDGQVIGEGAFILSVTVLHGTADMHYNRIKQSICTWAAHYSIPTNWVHVERQDVKTMHFSVDEERMK